MPSSAATAAAITADWTRWAQQPGKPAELSFDGQAVGDFASREIFRVEMTAVDFEAERTGDFEKSEMTGSRADWVA